VTFYMSLSQSKVSRWSVSCLILQWLSSVVVLQPFVMEGLCTGCQSSMTRKSSAHWEGGKGCRDKIKMSRQVIDTFVRKRSTEGDGQTFKCYNW